MRVVVETYEEGRGWVPAHDGTLDESDGDEYAAALMFAGDFVRIRLVAAHAGSEDPASERA